ncbi:uncharacterized protein LOC129569902 [Sitodiplosis mosellana]|uniref:uncharacterized protein LOC129569902 n=1 Tax=Sitodiplosis mosellana TaxID=263140 RepID=UPI0024440E7B|nr:uncharacterized protein LOC129569902 [Sitodiplosis mosellana]
MAVSRLSLGKFLELVITITCLVLHYKSMGESDPHAIILASGTFVGYTVILVGLFAGYILSTPINKRIDIFFSLIGCALFIATGALILQDWNGGIHSALRTETHKLAVAKGWLAIVNGVLFFLDVIFTFRD